MIDRELTAADREALRLRRLQLAIEARQTLKGTSDFEDAILNLIDNRDDYTRSDLQGAVSAIVMRIQAGYRCDLPHALSQFVVSYREPIAPQWIQRFRCQAEDEAHAIEQCLDANPEALDMNAGKVQP